MMARTGDFMATPKTWKRETAWGALCAYWCSVAALAWGHTPEHTLEALSDVLSASVLPVHILAAALFGVDWYGKQGPGRVE